MRYSYVPDPFAELRRRSRRNVDAEAVALLNSALAEDRQKERALTQAQQEYLRRLAIEEANQRKLMEAAAAEHKAKGGETAKTLVPDISGRLQEVEYPERNPDKSLAYKSEDLPASEGSWTDSQGEAYLGRRTGQGNWVYDRPASKDKKTKVEMDEATGDLYYTHPDLPEYRRKLKAEDIAADPRAKALESKRAGRLLKTDADMAELEERSAYRDVQRLRDEAQSLNRQRKEWEDQGQILATPDQEREMLTGAGTYFEQARKRAQEAGDAAKLKELAEQEAAFSKFRGVTERQKELATLLPQAEEALKAKQDAVLAARKDLLAFQSAGLTPELRKKLADRLMQGQSRAEALRELAQENDEVRADKERELALLQASRDPGAKARRKQLEEELTEHDTNARALEVDGADPLRDIRQQLEAKQAEADGLVRKALEDGYATKNEKGEPVFIQSPQSQAAFEKLQTLQKESEALAKQGNELVAKQWEETKQQAAAPMAEEAKRIVEGLRLAMGPEELAMLEGDKPDELTLAGGKPQVGLTFQVWEPTAEDPRTPEQKAEDEKKASFMVTPDEAPAAQGLADKVDRLGRDVVPVVSAAGKRALLDALTPAPLQMLNRAFFGTAGEADAEEYRNRLYVDRATPYHILSNGQMVINPVRLEAGDWRSLVDEAVQSGKISPAQGLLVRDAYERAGERAREESIKQVMDFEPEVPFAVLQRLGLPGIEIKDGFAWVNGEKYNAVDFDPWKHLSEAGKRKLAEAMLSEPATLGDALRSNISNFFATAAKTATTSLARGVSETVNAVAQGVAGATGWEALSKSSDPWLVRDLSNRLDRVFDSSFKVDARQADDWWHAITGGAGSTVGFMAGGGVLKGGLLGSAEVASRLMPLAAARMGITNLTPKLASTLAVAFSGGAVQTDGMIEEARQAGMAEKDLWKVLPFSWGLGATEVVPVSNFIDKLSEPLQRQVSRGFLRTLASIAKEPIFETVEETGQEIFQTVGSNLVAQQLYDKHRGALDGVLKAAGGAAGSAFPVATVTELVARGLDRRRLMKLRKQVSQIKGFEGVDLATVREARDLIPQGSQRVQSVLDFMPYVTAAQEIRGLQKATPQATQMAQDAVRGMLKLKAGHELTEAERAALISLPVAQPDGTTGPLATAKGKELVLNPAAVLRLREISPAAYTLYESLAKPPSLPSQPQGTGDQVARPDAAPVSIQSPGSNESTSQAQAQGEYEVGFDAIVLPDGGQVQGRPAVRVMANSPEQAQRLAEERLQKQFPGATLRGVRVVEAGASAQAQQGVSSASQVTPSTPAQSSVSAPVSKATAPAAQSLPFVVVGEEAVTDPQEKGVLDNIKAALSDDYTAPIIRALGGIEIRIAKTRSTSGIEATGSGFVIDPRQVLANYPKFIGAEARYRMGVNEEVTHALMLQLFPAGSPMGQKLAEMWDSLPQSTKEKVYELYGRGAYPAEYESWGMGHEYIRMVIQLATQGKTTEVAGLLTPQARNVIEQILDFLRRIWAGQSLTQQEEESLKRLTIAKDLMAELKNMQGNPVLAQAIAAFNAALQAGQEMGGAAQSSQTATTESTPAQSTESRGSPALTAEEAAGQGKESQVKPSPTESAAEVPAEQGVQSEAVPVAEMPQAQEVEAKAEPSQAQAGSRGTATDIILPGGETISGTYVIVDGKNDIKPHPRNERDYTLKEEREKNEGLIKNFNPRLVVNDNPDAINGAPIFNRRTGHILAGNRRHLLIMEPRSREAYLSYLAQNASKFGLDGALAKGNAIMVREVDVAEDREEELVRLFNQPMTGALDLANDAVSAGRVLPPEVIAAVSDIFAEDSDKAPLQALIDADTKEIAKRLLDVNAIREADRPKYVGSNGRLTREGARYLRAVLLGGVIKDANILRQIEDTSLETKLLNGLAGIYQIAGRGVDIAPLVEAVKLELDRDREGIKNVLEYQAQGQLIGEGPSEAAKMAQRLLAGANARNARKVFTLWASQVAPLERGQSGMFESNRATAGELSPAEVDDILTRANTIQKAADDLKGRIATGMGLAMSSNRTNTDELEYASRLLKKLQGIERSGKALTPLQKEQKEKAERLLGQQFAFDGMDLGRKPVGYSVISGGKLVGFDKQAEPELFDQKTSTTGFFREGEDQGRLFMSPEADARYLELAKDPIKNREELQRMVDAAAKRAGYTEKAYHGSPNKPFWVFDPLRKGERTGANSALLGFFATNKKEVAEQYRMTAWERDNAGYTGPLGFNLENAEKELELANSIEVFAEFDPEQNGFVGKLKYYDDWASRHEWNAFPYDPYGTGERKAVFDDKNIALEAAQFEKDFLIKKAKKKLDEVLAKYEKAKQEKLKSSVVHDLYLKFENPLIYDYKGGSYEDKSYSELIQEAIAGGHDGVIMENTRDAMDDDTPSDVFVFFKSSQAKLADPVTYDEQGNVIPLSQRFNPKSDSILYMGASADQVAQLEEAPETQAYAKNVAVLSAPTQAEIVRSDLIGLPAKAQGAVKNAVEKEKRRLAEALGMSARPDGSFFERDMFNQIRFIERAAKALGYNSIDDLPPEDFTMLAVEWREKHKRVDVSAALAYLVSEGAPANNPGVLEESERISQSLAPDSALAMGSLGEGLAQGELFAPEARTAAIPAAPSQDNDSSGQSSPSRLQRGLMGNWEDLAEEVREKGRASSIIHDLVNLRINGFDPVGIKVKTPGDIAAIMQPLRNPYQEMLKVLVLDDSNRVVAGQVLFIGKVNEIAVGGREAFGALQRLRVKTGKNYTRIVFSHNHPSGDPTPSTADIQFHNSMVKMGEQAGFQVVDHVITNGTSYWSALQAGFPVGSASSKTGPKVRGKRTPALPSPQLQNLAPWEVVARMDLPVMDGPDKMAPLIHALRQGSEHAAHIVWLNTKLRITAISRVPLLDTEFLARPIEEAWIREGAMEAAYSGIIVLPDKFPTGPRERLIVNLLDQSQEIKLLDIVGLQPDGRMFSAAAEGYTRSRLAMSSAGEVAEKAGPSYGIASPEMRKSIQKQGQSLFSSRRFEPDANKNSERDSEPEIKEAITKVTNKIAGGASVKFVSSVPNTVRAALASLKNRMGMLKVSKETHPTVVSWIARNENAVPWANVRTLEQLTEFVKSRLAERMKPEQYEISFDDAKSAEQAEIRVLQQNAENGDREAARALDLYRQGGWERVLKEFINPQRKANAEAWKKYLTEENEEYAKDVFWQDLAWDILESYLRSDRAYGLGETVNLNQGALAQLREETKTKNLSLPKAYRELLRQFAIASAADKVATGQGKTWIYIPWKGEDPENFAANVQKLKDLSNDCYCTKTYNAGPYLSDGSFWMLQENGRTKVAIRLHRNNSKVAEIKSEDNTDQIPEEYVDDVMDLLKQRNIPGGESFIVANEKDPQRQIELANSGDKRVQYDLASNTNLVLDAQLILVKNPIAQQYLASNPSIALETQRILAKSGRPSVIAILARNKSIDPQIQTVLAQNKYAQYALAENPSIVLDAQLIIAKSNEVDAQKNLAQNESIAREAQIILAKSDNVEVQHTLALNPVLTSEARQILKDKGFKFSKTGTDIEAYYDPSNDELVFNISAIDSVKRAEELAFHEVNHRNVFMLAQDENGRQELKRIIAAARPILRQHLPELLSKTGHTSIEQLKSDYGWNDENGDVAVDYELLARYAENLRGRKPPSWFERIISEIKLWLNKNFGTGLSDKDVLHWLSRIGVDKAKLQAGGDIQASRRTSVVRKQSSLAPQLAMGRRADANDAQMQFDFGDVQATFEAERNKPTPQVAIAAQNAVNLTPAVLFQAHIDRADRMARVFDNLGLEFEDRKQIALMALRDAAQTYNPTSNVPFAAWADQLMRRALVREYRKERRQRRGGGQKDLRLDEPIKMGEGDDAEGDDTMGALLADPKAEPASTKVAKSEAALAVRAAIAELKDPRARQVAELLMAGNNGQEIGEALGYPADSAREMGRRWIERTLIALRFALQRRGMDKVATLGMSAEGGIVPEEDLPGGKRLDPNGDILRTDQMTEEELAQARKNYDPNKPETWPLDIDASNLLDAYLEAISNYDSSTPAVGGYFVSNADDLLENIEEALNSFDALEYDVKTYNEGISPAAMDALVALRQSLEADREAINKRAARAYEEAVRIVGAVRERVEKELGIVNDGAIEAVPEDDLPGGVRLDPNGDILAINEMSEEQLEEARKNYNPDDADTWPLKSDQAELLNEYLEAIENSDPDDPIPGDYFVGDGEEKVANIESALDSLNTFSSSIRKAKKNEYEDGISPGIAEEVAALRRQLEADKYALKKRAIRAYNESVRIVDAVRARVERELGGANLTQGTLFMSARSGRSDGRGMDETDLRQVRLPLPVPKPYPMKPGQGKSLDPAKKKTIAGKDPADYSAEWRNIERIASEIEYADKAQGQSKDESKAKKSPGLLTDIFAGQLDKLEAYAPGTKAIMLDARRNKALVQAALNSLQDKIAREIRAQFGYSSWWRTPRQWARMKRFVAMLSPVAAHLEVERVAPDGTFVFKPFNMRAGVITKKQADAFGLLPGMRFLMRDGKIAVPPKPLEANANAAEKAKHAALMRQYNLLRTQEGVEEYIVGQETEEKDGYVRLRPMSAEKQMGIYLEFKRQYPEAIGWLDRWIDPQGANSAYVHPSGVTTAEFNRYSLYKLYEQSPYGSLPEVEGYTPDVMTQRSLAAVIASVAINPFKKYASPARKFKSGMARETGQVKDIFQGFSIRAMQAHQEKLLADQRAALLEKTIQPGSDIPPDQKADYVTAKTPYVTVDAVLRQVLSAAAHVQGLKLPVPGNALAPENKEYLEKVFGAGARFAGQGYVIPRVVFNELVRTVATQKTTHSALALLEGLLSRLNTGLLASPGTYVTNVVSNEMLKALRGLNRFWYAVISGLAGEGVEAQRAFAEARNIAKGFITDRFLFSANKERIGELVPKELFNDQTAIAAFNVDVSLSAGEQLKNLNAGGALLRLYHYEDVDIYPKMQLAFAAYMAHAEVAARLAEREGQDVPKDAKKRLEWMRNWIKNAPPGLHREVYNSTVLFLMDYANVPRWLQGDIDNEYLRVAVKGLLPFFKFSYNYIRLLKRTSWDSVKMLMPGKSKLEKIEGAANLMMHVTLMALGAALYSLGDDDETPLVGTSIDEEGNRLDGPFRTAGRLNVTGPMRSALAFFHMLGLDPLGDVNLDEKQFWLHYRKYPFVPQALLLGALATGRWPQAGEVGGAMLEEFVSTGILFKLAAAPLGFRDEYDANKTLGWIAGETGLDIATSGVLPPPLRRMAVEMVDPVTRRNKPNKSLAYEGGIVDALKANTPFLSQTLPPAGKVLTYEPTSAKLQAIRRALDPYAVVRAERTFRDPNTGKMKTAIVDPESTRITPRALALARYLLGINIRAFPKAQKE